MNGGVDGAEQRSSDGTDARVPVLSVESLSISLTNRGRALRLLDGVSFQLHPGQTIGLIGESGAGKSLTALAIARLLPRGGVWSVRGSVQLSGRELLSLGEREMRSLRGGRIGFVFQDPMSSLNPVLTVGEQIAEPLRIHKRMTHRESRAAASDLLDMVEIADVQRCLKSFPHELSGGMRQRVMIAIALSCEPDLLIADEPTTSLDVTIQSQILDLISDLSSRLGTAVVMITHDLGVAARMCDTICVMYAGQVVEQGDAVSVLCDSRMPYTAGLLAALPSIERSSEQGLVPIDGFPPALDALPPGCLFAPRCQHVRELCRETRPSLTNRAGDQHLTRCWGAEEGGWLSARRHVNV